MIIQNGNCKEKSVDFFLKKFENKQDLFYNVISIDEIRERLNSNINAIYFAYLKNSNGSYIFPTHEIFIRIDISDNSKSLALAHELWHGISLHEDGTGFLHIDNKNNSEYGRFFNEGITDCLAEDLVGEKFPKDDYEVFRNTCRVLFTMIDKKLFFRDYLYGTDEVKTEFLNKYGEDVLESYNSVLSLIDVIGSYNLNYSSIQTNTIYNKTNSNYKNVDDAKNALDNVLQEMLDRTAFKEIDDER